MATTKIVLTRLTQHYGEPATLRIKDQRFGEAPALRKNMWSRELSGVSGGNIHIQIYLRIKKTKAKKSAFQKGSFEQTFSLFILSKNSSHCLTPWGVYFSLIRVSENIFLLFIFGNVIWKICSLSMLSLKFEVPVL